MVSPPKVDQQLIISSSAILLLCSVLVFLHKYLLTLNGSFFSNRDAWYVTFIIVVIVISIPIFFVPFKYTWHDSIIAIHFLLSHIEIDTREISDVYFLASGNTERLAWSTGINDLFTYYGEWSHMLYDRISVYTTSLNGGVILIRQSSLPILINPRNQEFRSRLLSLKEKNTMRG